MQSGIPVVMFGLDVTVDAYLNGKDIQDIRDFNTKISKFFADVVQSNLNFYIKNYKREILCIHDAVSYTHLDVYKRQLLMMFVNNRGTAFPREQILSQVWEENYFGSDRVVDDTLRRLRKKMPNLSIHTIYGFGYRLG